MHQRRALQRVSGPFALQIMVCYRAKVLIDERNERFERGLISCPPLQKKLRN